MHESQRTYHPRPNLLLATLALAGGSYSLLQSLVSPALPELQRHLGASTAGSAWIFTSLLLSASVVTPIAGRLGDMFGKKRTYLVLLALLGIGTLISALADDLPLMIVGRLIQGAGSALFPISFAIVRDELPPKRVPGAIAVMAGLLGIGGGLGIVLAGPIVENLSVAWLFWLPLVAIALAMVSSFRLIPESTLRSPGKVNWLAAALLSGWLVCLLLGVTQGPSWGWGSARTIGLLAGAVALLVTWVRVEDRSPLPLVDMKMLRIRAVWTTNFATVLIGYGMFASYVLVPQFVEIPASTGYGFGSTVTEAGLFLLPTTVAMLLIGPVTGRLSSTLGPKVPFVAGAAIGAASFGLLTFLHSEPRQIYLATTLNGLGIGLTFASMANLIVEAVPRDQTGVATGMNAIMRTIGGALGSQVSASILAAHVAGGMATEAGFEMAFAACALVLLLGTAAAIGVPSKAARASSAAERSAARSG